MMLKEIQLNSRQNFPIKSDGPIVIVCNDAGATNLLLSWTNHWSMLGFLDGMEVRIVVSGPAKLILEQFQKSLKNHNIFLDLDQALLGADFLISGTGWASDVEHEARRIAQSKGIYSVAVIDHWVNYHARFVRNNIAILPNEIWVSDHYAYDLAKNTFQSLPIIELPNIYLAQLVDRVNSLQALHGSNKLLYVLEPARNKWGREIEGEFQGLNYAVKNINKIVNGDKFQLILRPHPSDSIGKYNEWIAINNEVDILIDSKSSLENLISQAKWVVGLQTYAMVIALTAGKKTFSSLPPYAPKCVLPFENIVLL